MSSRRILVVYATGYGQTARIAGRMADLLRHVGDDVTVIDAARSPRLLTVRAYDGVIVGSPVAFGRHQRSIRRFVLEHQDELNTRPSVFFSVNGAAVGDGDAERTRARRCVHAFLHETGWRPARTTVLGGAVPYTRYDLLHRWWTGRAMAKRGGPTETSRDRELTDWSEVRRFVEDVVALMPRRLPADRPERIVPPAPHRRREWRFTPSSTAATGSAG
ncbi:MAG: protoporphyrinogen oxidase [Gemmatimonadaceae bacterium]|nr:protoporphyrinogen oxidase [Gemmatimonadaceae bacterium]NUQ93868.1 protoporphyrinogen oxidase [Gemmatimonadaceae bacterium]NUR20546.1 protoporphyrinogen oxidase [Gemmatimonadaceae bacterium]NUS96950.1 protoporphyrinogen oxidase [Gemmatimonadaceae bacterium]